MPEGLTIGRVVTASEVLLRSVVSEGDTFSCEGKDNCTRKLCVVSHAIQKASVVMVIDEEAGSTDIGEFTLLLVVPVLDSFHALLAAEDVPDRVVHRVVEEASDVVLVRADICRVTVEAFAHLEHTS